MAVPRSPLESGGWRQQRRRLHSLLRLLRLLLLLLVLLVLLGLILDLMQDLANSYTRHLPLGRSSDEKHPGRRAFC